MTTVKVAGKKVTTLGEEGRLYVMVTGIGRTYVPKEHGLKEGDVLNGSVSVEEKTYATDKEGKPRDTPLVRMELVDYTSFDDQLSCAFSEARIAAIPNMVFKPADFTNISAALATA